MSPSCYRQLSFPLRILLFLALKHAGSHDLIDHLSPIINHFILAPNHLEAIHKDFRPVNSVKGVENDVVHRYYSEPVELHSHEQRIITPGDVILGGLFQIHHSLLNSVSGCDGHIKGEKGIQRMEAMLFAVDLVNSNPDLLPGVLVGVDIADTCSLDTIAMSQCMTYIHANELNNAIPVPPDSYPSHGFDVKNYECLPTPGEYQDNSRSLPKLVPPRLLVAVIGPSSSQEMSLVAGIFHAFKIPQIGYAATSYELSQKSKYEYFSRVVPPDNYQARAMIDIVKAFNWTYVSIVAAEGVYGKKGIEAFENLAKESGVCVAMAYFLDSIPTESDFDSVIEALLEKNLARGVVTFMDEENLRGLLEASIRAKTVGHFVWLGSDSWGAKVTPVKELEVAAEGAITLLPKRKNVKGFDEYFKSLLSSSNHRNIWFDEYIKSQINCTLFNTDTSDRCNVIEAIQSEQEGLIPFVIDAVHLAAHAFHNLLRFKCGEDYFGLCENAKYIKSWEILPYIRNTSFVGTQGDVISLDQNGDVKGRYSIYQYQKDIDGHYDYGLMGEWDENLNLNTDLIKWKGRVGAHNLPDSVCSYPCEPGYVMRMDIQQKCCWVCIKCGPNEYTDVHPLLNGTVSIKNTLNSSILFATSIEDDDLTNQTRYPLLLEDICIPCPTGHVLNITLNSCIQLPITYLKWSDAWAIIPTCLAVAGLIGTLIVIIIFVKHNDRLVVAGSCPELCYLILMGLVLCYTMTLILLSKPTTPSCAIIKLGLGTSLTLFYATLFIKILYMHQHFGEKSEIQLERSILPTQSFLTVPLEKLRNLKNHSTYNSDNMNSETTLNKIDNLKPNLVSQLVATKTIDNCQTNANTIQNTKSMCESRKHQDCIIKNFDIVPQSRKAKKGSVCFKTSQDTDLADATSDSLFTMDNPLKSPFFDKVKKNAKKFSFKRRDQRSQQRFLSLPILGQGKSEASPCNLNTALSSLSLKRSCPSQKKPGSGKWTRVARNKDKIIASRIRFSIDNTHSKKDVKTKKMTKKFISLKLPENAKARTFICVVIVLLHALGLLVWWIIEPSKTWIDYSFSREAILRCAVSNFSIVLSLLFNMIQICLGTVWAFKTRNVSQNFNEAKFITFAMYSTCVVWLAFIPIFLGTDNDFRIQTSTLSMCLAISAWVALGMFFVPKIYIILFQSHKNSLFINIPTKFDSGQRVINDILGKKRQTMTIANNHAFSNNQFDQSLCHSSLSEEVKDLGLDATYKNDIAILDAKNKDSDILTLSYISPILSDTEANSRISDCISIGPVNTKQSKVKTSIHANIKSEAEIEI